MAYSSVATTPPLLAADEQAEAAVTFVAESPSCKLHNSCFLANGSSRRQNASTVQKKLLIACCLSFIFMIAEVVGGFYAHSVAIMSDAAHMLSDVSSFLVALVAAWAATRASTEHYSFGYHRAEIMGALVSVLIIWLVTGALVFEAAQRVKNPVEVNGKLMFIIAASGVVFNLVVALVLGHTHSPLGDHSNCSHGHDHGHGHDHPHGPCTGSHSSHPHRSKKKQHPHLHTTALAITICPEAPTSSPHTSLPHRTVLHPTTSLTAAEAAAPGRARKHTDTQQQQQQQQQQQVGDGVGAAEAEEDALFSPITLQLFSSSRALTGAARSGQGEAGYRRGGDCSDRGREVEGQGSTRGGSGHNTGNDSLGCGHRHGSCHTSAHSHSKQEGSCSEAGHAHSAKHGHSPSSCKEAAGDGHITHSLDVEQGAAPDHAHGDCCHGHSHGQGQGREGAAAGGERGHSHGGHHCGGGGHGHDGGGEHENINLRGAVLHVIGDLLQSVGVAIAGLLIWTHQGDPRWYIADPLCTFGFSILVLLTTRSILRDIFHVLMERSPPGLDVPSLARSLHSLPGVQDVHDLHVWTLSMGLPVLTAHAHILEGADPKAVLRAFDDLCTAHGIRHTTLQICNPVTASPCCMNQGHLGAGQQVGRLPGVPTCTCSSSW